MTQSGFTSIIVNGLLGWLKGLASWVLRLFDLVGGASPLEFLANNWLKLLIILMVIGIGADILIYLLRWRPHWVWFKKKRIVINDNNFFAREDEPATYNHRPDRRAKPRRVWEDEEFVVPTTTVSRRAGAPRGERTLRPQRIDKQVAPRQETVHTDVFRDDLFNVNAKQKFSDRYEDEVFNVESLPNRKDAQSDGAARGSDIRSRTEQNARVTHARPLRRIDGKNRRVE